MKVLLHLFSNIQNKEQFTSIGRRQSKKCTLEVGVPASHNLGDFLIYINDFHSFKNGTRCILFTDDKTKSVNGQTLNETKTVTWLFSLLNNETMKSEVSGFRCSYTCQSNMECSSRVPNIKPNTKKLFAKPLTVYRDLVCSVINYVIIIWKRREFTFAEEDYQDNE